MLWIVGGACIVCLALLAHELLRRRRDATGPSARAGQPPPARLVATQPAGGPVNWAEDPLAGMGITVLAEDGAEATAPPGAIRKSAFRRQLPDATADIITYVVAAKLPDVEAFYRTRLAATDYRLSRVTRSPDGRASLLFLAGRRRQYNVRLLPTDNPERVKIILVISRPR